MWFLTGGNNNNRNTDSPSSSSSESESESDSPELTSSSYFENIVTGCSKSNHTDYLSHGDETWTLLQQAHDRVKGKRSHYKSPPSGMLVPFEIRQTTTQGQHLESRSLYVTEDVELGTQVWQPLHYHRNGQD